MDYAEALNAGANQVAQMQGIAQANNAWSAGQAQIQREWQEQQNAKAMAFNRSEAAKNRNWQEMLSNTAHQREVKDLMAAGLNPVLSAMNGNGASVGSGATAQGVTSQGAKGDTDVSANGAIANLLGSILAANTQIQAANINARTVQILLPVLLGIILTVPLPLLCTVRMLQRLLLCSVLLRPQVLLAMLLIRRVLLLGMLLIGVILLLGMLLIRVILLLSMLLILNGILKRTLVMVR